MIGIFALLAGTLLGATAAGAKHQTEREERIRMLTERLTGTGVLPPIPTGIDIWRWPDGHRIVRMVLPEEVEAAFHSLSEPGDDITEIKDDLLESVEPTSPDQGGGPEFEGPHLYVYLNERNQPRALVAVDTDQILLGGPEGKIHGNKIRGRVFRFLRDNDLEEFDTEHVLWHDEILVHELLIPSMDRVDQGFKTESEWREFLESVPYALRDYIYSYHNLKDHMRLLDSTQAEIERISKIDPDSQKAINFLGESGVEIDGDESIQRLLNREIEGITEWMNEQTMVDLHNEMDTECSEADSVLESHDIKGIGQSTLDRFVITNDAFDWRNEEGVIEGGAKLRDYHGDPSVRWSLTAGGSYGDSEEAGHIRLIEDWLETKKELYEKGDEPTWVWPGNLRDTSYEMDVLLGIRTFEPARMDLLDFVGISYDLGLTHPGHIKRWGFGVKDWEASRTEPRYPISLPVQD